MRILYRPTWSQIPVVKGWSQCNMQPRPPPPPPPRDWSGITDKGQYFKMKKVTTKS